ncbi:MAG: dienelactone hydrolase family protein [Bryobacterales bacterium]|nr:dienelactone hydrolase family protein [Bryobacterales bacterium]
MRPLFFCLSLSLLTLYAPLLTAQGDPLIPIFAPEATSSVVSLMDHYRQTRRYRTENFPMASEQFRAFQADVVHTFIAALGIEDWQVRNPPGKQSPIAPLYRDRLLRRFTHEGVEMEAHLIEILSTGDQVPAVLCLPPGDAVVPGVACYPGHSKSGLRDLVLDDQSYQRAIAKQLAKAGFASIAVERLDSGYLARTPVATDENAASSFRLGMGVPTRAVELMAGLAALEILAAHPRVDETRLGATGVSLGGWLAVQVGLLSDRVKAVAEFGTKTVFLSEETTAHGFEGIPDACYVIPGTLAVGDRNMLMLAYAPRPLLSGHGGPDDRDSHAQYARYYRPLFQAQYAALGQPENYRYYVHDGGHAMHAPAVIDYFQKLLAPAAP